jgi:hypothetical protein
MKSVGNVSEFVFLRSNYMQFEELLYRNRKICDLKDMMEQSEKLFGSKNAFLVKDSNSNYKGLRILSLRRILIFWVQH